ncbi:hypothetical protein F8A90_05890 [Cobetia sp. cqz5-12]|uniref:hypothetical protein n=1 Tax=Cobetia sp. cqz5-12 TaxID=2609415 RepID=UPI00190904BC|nr:hypothetical protein [Cobetia sp. cqz5-12]QQK63710.1 hypothetical protein F8A90_05890 [Cobetia sp. cqz5-12]
MEDELAQAITTVVCAFIITQIFLKYIIEPAVLLKKSIGKISFVFLANQSKLTNATGSEELRQSIKDCSASLMEGHQSIPFYKVIGPIFGLPAEQNIFESAKCLNVICSQLYVDPESGAINQPMIIFENMKEIKERLGIIISYE